MAIGVPKERTLFSRALGLLLTTVIHHLYFPVMPLLSHFAVAVMIITSCPSQQLPVIYRSDKSPQENLFYVQ